MATGRTIGRVFISHSGQDRELARDLARRLRQVSLEPVLEDDNYETAAEWRKELRGQLQRADAVLFLVTPAALRSPWMVAELGMADAFEHPIIPVTVSVQRHELPAPFQTLQTVPFDEVDGAINALAEQLTASPNRS